MFSIITANYNGKDYLKQVIESVQEQTFTNWEMIIFDDGSKDGSLEMAKDFAVQNPKIKVFSHPGNKNLGLAKTLQKAISLAKGEYIAFLENDDYWHKTYLEEKIKVLNKNKNFIVINKPIFFGEEKRTKRLSSYYKIIYYYCQILNFSKNIWNLNKIFSVLNPVCSFSTLCAKREMFEELDFNTPFAPWLDKWLLLQLSFKHKFYFLDKELTFWRLSNSSWTMKSLKEKEKGAKKFNKEAFKLYKKNLSSFSFIILKIYYTFANLFIGLGKFILNKVLRLS